MMGEYGCVSVFSVKGFSYQIVLGSWCVMDLPEISSLYEKHI